MPQVHSPFIHIVCNCIRSFKHTVGRRHFSQSLNRYCVGYTHVAILMTMHEGEIYRRFWRVRRLLVGLLGYITDIKSETRLASWNASHMQCLKRGLVSQPLGFPRRDRIHKSLCHTNMFSDCIYVSCSCSSVLYMTRDSFLIALGRRL